MRKDQNRIRLKWYQRKVFSNFLLIFFVISILSAIDEKDISYLLTGLLFLFTYFLSFNSRIKTLKNQSKNRSENQSETLKPIKTNIYIKQSREQQEEQKYLDYKKEENENLQPPQEILKFSKIRKLSPDFVVLDFETTGLSPINDRIIQVAAVKYREFEKTDEFLTYVNPKITIPSNITKLNGISDNDVKNAPLINEVLPLLIEFIDNNVIVAHNASFDLKFLLTNMYFHGIEYKKFRVVDTLTLAKKHIDFTKNYKLETMKSFLKLNHLKSHDALHDCYVTAELYKYCYQESLSRASL